MNFRFLLTLVLAACSISLSAQSSLTQKFRKNVPVQMTYYERLYDANNTRTSKNKLKKTKEFTDSEVEEIFTRLGIDSEIPSKLNNQDREALQHYVVYEISDFSLMGYKFSLIWIPYDENKHMPKNMQPPTKDGTIFYTYTKHLSFNGKDASGNLLAKAGTPLSAPEPINVSVADMSQFLNGGKEKMKDIPQVFKAGADPQLVKQGEADYYAMQSRFPNISKEYTQFRDKVFAQVLEDRKTGTQANLFMKKEREGGQKLLDEWHSKIDAFLKKYSAIITPEAEAEISGWHNQALHYIDY
jgi:hypothetical protein